MSAVVSGYGQVAVAAFAVIGTISILTAKLAQVVVHAALRGKCGSQAIWFQEQVKGTDCPSNVQYG
jgi:hypothetical protein